MAYETRDNSGRLFKNEEKKNERGPDYSGDCTINGEAFYMDAWLKTADSGRKWMSFSFKPKQQRAGAQGGTQPYPSTQKPSAPQKPAGKPCGGFADMDDDVPFADPHKGAKAYVV